MIIDDWKETANELPPLFTDVLLVAVDDQGAKVVQGFLMLNGQWVYSGSGLLVIGQQIPCWTPLPSPPESVLRSIKNRVIEDYGKGSTACKS